MSLTFDMPLQNLVTIVMQHRGLTEGQALDRVRDALANVNGTYTVMGRFPDEIIAHGRGGDGVTLKRGLDAPPKFDANGYAIEPEAPDAERA